MTTAITNYLATQKVYDKNKYRVKNVWGEIQEISKRVAEYKHKAEGIKGLIKKIMKSADKQNLIDVDAEMKNQNPLHWITDEDGKTVMYTSLFAPDFSAVYKTGGKEYVIVGSTMRTIESDAPNFNEYIKRYFGGYLRNRKVRRVELEPYFREDPIRNYEALEKEMDLMDKTIADFIAEYSGRPEMQEMIVTRLLGSFNYKPSEFADHVRPLLNSITLNALGAKQKLIKAAESSPAFGNEMVKTKYFIEEQVKAKYKDVMSVPITEVMGMYSDSFNINDRLIKQYFSGDPTFAKQLTAINNEMRLAHNTAFKTLMSVKKWWLSSNFNSHFFNKPYVSPVIWGNYINVFQKLTDITFLEGASSEQYFKGLAEAVKKMSVKSNTVGSKVKAIKENLEHDLAARLFASITGREVGEKGVTHDIDKAKLYDEETTDFIEMVKKYANGEKMTGVNGEAIVKNVPDDVKHYLGKMKDLLAKNPALLANFEGTYIQYTGERFGMPTNFQNISYRELIDFVKYLDGLANAKFEGGLKLGKQDYYLLPERFNTKHLPHDPSIVPVMLPVWHPRYNKLVPQEVYIPMSRIGQNYKALLNITQQSDSTGATIDYELNKELPLGLIKQSLAKQHPEAAIDIFEYAFAKRTRKDSPQQASFVMDRVRRKYGEKRFNILNKKEGTYQSMSIDEIATVIDREATDYFQNSIAKYIIDNSDQWFIPYTRRNPDMKYMEWVDIYRLMDDHLIPSAINNDRRAVSFGLNGLQKIAYFDSLYRTELPLLEEKGGKKVLSQTRKTMLDFIEEGKFEEGAKWLDELSDYTFNKINPSGMDVTVELVQPYEWLKREHVQDRIEMFTINENTIAATEMYFPRMGTSEKELQTIMQRNMEAALKRNDKKEAARIYTSMQLKFGADALRDYEHIQDYVKLLHKRSIDEDTFRSTFVHTRPRHLMQRDYDEGITKYRLDLAVLSDYAKSLKDNYYKKLSMIVGNRLITKFEEEANKGFINIDKENISGWTKFMRMNLIQSIGGNSLYPKEFVDDPGLHMKDSGYYYFTDQAVADKITKANKFFGVEESDVKEIREAKVAAKLATVSNLEAKWSLLTLLTRPKSAIINLFGGNLNVAMNVGLKPLRMSYDLQYLGSLNPEWKSMADVERSIDEYGGIEAFVKAEAGLSPELRGPKMRRFVERVKMKLREDPEVADNTLYEIAKQEGVFNEVVNAGAWFMRRSERLARRQAWLAHYIKAREVFEKGLESKTSEFSWDDPWLIEMANRGVHSTQFLYNAVNRPMFAKTALGKMFTRFQIWAYNSLNFRVQVAKDAFRYGYKEGTSEYQRFERMALADLFVMGAAMFLPMSLFGSSVPTPWVQMQGIAQFLFGDDEQKERAFYGVLPYPLNITQVVLPPSSRYFTSLFTTMMTNDWEKFASFHVWSWFPFGAVGMDVKNAVLNPSLTTERLLSIPYNTLAGKFGKLSHPYSLFNNRGKGGGSLEPIIRGEVVGVP